MTPAQLTAAYQESFRQEARGSLMDIHCMTIPRAGKKGEAAFMDLQYTAYPPDPDSDEDFGKDGIRALKDMMKGDKNA